MLMIFPRTFIDAWSLQRSFCQDWEILPTLLYIGKRRPHYQVCSNPQKLRPSWRSISSAYYKRSHATQTSYWQHWKPLLTSAFSFSLHRFHFIPYLFSSFYSAFYYQFSSSLNNPLGIFTLKMSTNS